MNFRLRQVADVPVSEAKDFSESVFDELQERVAKRALQAMENATPPAKINARNDWSSLRSVEDWKAFHAERPEWQGLSTSAMQKSSQTGGYAFYQAFAKWCKAASDGEEGKRLELIETVFPKMLNSWESFVTLRDWKAYHAARPEFQGVPAGGMKSVSGGYAFYAAYVNWCKEEAAGDDAKRRALVEEIFQSQLRSWEPFAKLQDWKDFHEARPEWKGLTSGTIRSVEGGTAFYGAFAKWCKAEAAGDKTRQRELMETLFPPAHNSWKRFSTIGEWAAFFGSKPEWRGLSTGDLRATKEGDAFYVAFSRWCHERSGGDESAKRELMSQVLVARYRSWNRFSSLDDWVRHFSTMPEWHGLSTEEIQNAEGGRAFYQAFAKWCKKESAGDEAKRKALVRTVFPPRGRNRWRFED